MKLHLTLDNEKGNKLERTLVLDDINENIVDIVQSMVDTFDKVDVENK